jgi:hypothetical protein
MTATLDRCKTALQIAAGATAYDEEINDLIATARLDLKIAGVVDPVDHSNPANEDDKLIQTAIVTYVCMNFNNPSNYERLKKSYDEQKSQLNMADGYTDWSV